MSIVRLCGSGLCMAPRGQASYQDVRMLLLPGLQPAHALAGACAG